MDLITQKEFVEEYSKGKRVFENVLMQFTDISTMMFSDLVIKNSKLIFCTFLDCLMKNVAFENCEIYAGSFYNGSISSVLFSKCQIELTLFEGIRFEKAKMDKCVIRLSAIFNSNDASVDFSTSIQNRLLTSVSQLTKDDIEMTIAEAMPMIERLDVSTRIKLKELLKQDMERYNISEPAKEKSSRYDRKEESTHLSYGEVRQLIESTFGAYTQKNQYKMKSPYERQDENKIRRSGPPF
jgi:hypothetical protein